MRHIRQKRIVLFSVSLLLCLCMLLSCTGGRTTKRSTVEHDGITVEAGLTKEEVSRNGAIASWLERSDSEGFKLIGTYVLYYLSEDTFTCIVYRSDLSRAARTVDANLVSEDGETVLEIAFTSADSAADFDITCVTVPIREKPVIRILCDGESDDKIQTQAQEPIDISTWSPES
ncbi:MAG: hypothetical protein IJR83_08165 [Clostridia bacterium]|nr:hypothetical protein [Clostridia bacterium]